LRWVEAEREDVPRVVDPPFAVSEDSDGLLARLLDEVLLRDPSDIVEGNV